MLILFLAFYIVHEVVNKRRIVYGDRNNTKTQRTSLLIVEPPFHVSKTAFEETIGKAKAAGFTEVKRPKVVFNKAVVLKK